MSSSIAGALSTLSDRGLRRLLGARTFLRGLDYEKRKVVGDLKVSQSDATARIKGSDNDPYLTTIQLGGEGISSQCSCPAFQKTGHHCKHVAALLITVRNQARAQQPPAAPTRVVVRAARMLDVESGRIVPDARIVIEGDRIQAINPASLPAGVRVIDLGDLTLAPGFIDTHTHLGGEIGANMLLEPVTTTEVDAAFNAVKNGHRTLMAGFTTADSMPSGSSPGPSAACGSLGDSHDTAAPATATTAHNLILRIHCLLFR